MSGASKSHSEENEPVLSDYIDMEVYDVVSGPTYRALVEQFDASMDVLNYAWTIICNVSEGDWAQQSQGWQDAAAKCRDQYHALLASNPAKRTT